MASPKLPPLHTTYEPYQEEVSDRVELSMPKCKHELYLVSSTEAKCRLCGVGYMGNGIVGLVQASKK